MYTVPEWRTVGVAAALCAQTVRDSAIRVKEMETAVAVALKRVEAAVRRPQCTLRCAWWSGVLPLIIQARICMWTIVVSLVK